MGEFKFSTRWGCWMGESRLELLDGKSRAGLLDGREQTENLMEVLG
jgi:hypothetical protein